MNFSQIEDILVDIARGKPVVVIDNQDRENEGDLIVAAEKISVETLNFMLQYGKGLVCLALCGERVRALGLGDQVVENSSLYYTRFTVSIDHCSVLGRGITAPGRVKTILAAVDPLVTAEEFVVPGYVFPLCAAHGGVLQRRGHTEASVDLARLAGLAPAGVICEIMDASGTMVGGAALDEYCLSHGLRLTSIEAIYHYRLRHGTQLRRVASCNVEQCRLNSAGTPLRVFSYVDDVDGKEHLAFVQGEPQNGCLVRLHSECLTGDVFESLRCDCGDQLRLALEQIRQAGEGVVIYLDQEGRGIGLGNKLRAYELQDRGRDTVQANLELGFKADYRDYRAGAQILADLGLRSIRLMTNNPEKVDSLRQFGIEVTERVILPVISHSGNVDYLRTKRERLGHILPFLSV